MILLPIYIYIYSYTQYSFQKYAASLWEVAFQTHSSPSERVWLSMEGETGSNGENIFKVKPPL